MASTGEKILDELLSNVQRSFREDRTILSFGEYFQLVADAPKRQLRSSAQYQVDMLDYFGWEERDLPTGQIRRAKLFDAEFADGEFFVAGQEAVVQNIYRCLCNFAREGRVNKLILLHGPNGSAKSSIVRCMMAGMEEYSRPAGRRGVQLQLDLPVGAACPRDSIGFGAPRRAKGAGDSFAYLPAESIDARVPCLMRDHPLFLLPQPQRAKLLDQLVPDAIDPTKEEA